MLEAQCQVMFVILVRDVAIALGGKRLRLGAACEEMVMVVLDRLRHCVGRAPTSGAAKTPGLTSVWGNGDCC